MSTTARKARKRARVPFAKPAKHPTRRHGDPLGIGLITGPEIIARILARSSR